MVIYGGFEPWAFAGCFTAVWISAATFWDIWDKSASKKGRWQGMRRLSRSYYGMVLGHLGVAITMVGASVVSNYGIEREIRMVPGDSVTMAGYQFNFVGMTQRQGPNFTANVGNFEVYRDGRAVSTIRPEKREYRVRRDMMTEAGIDASLSRDLFVAVGEQLSSNAWAIRIQYKPLIRCLWLGALFMACGGFLAISDRRYRVRAKLAAKVAAREESAGGGKSAPTEALS
jgi:cytochrome c-type biogenesis protein CcmF